MPTSSPRRAITIATRSSTLAWTQAGTICQWIQNQGYEVELVAVTTPGDMNMSPVERIGVGVFTTAIREAVTSGRCDIAVHSCKDLPTAPDDALTMAAHPVRENAADVLISAHPGGLSGLPAGAKVGTSSPRRISQLRKAIMDQRCNELDIQPLRGNIDTRIGYVRQGKLDAVILANAGVCRVGRGDEVSEAFHPELMLPAPAQGALAVECRSDDTELIELLAGLDDADTRAAVTAERQVLATLEAGCTAPVGAYAIVESGQLRVEATVVSVDGTTSVRSHISGPASEAAALGDTLARQLLTDGAANVLDTPQAQS